MTGLMIRHGIDEGPRVALLRRMPRLYEDNYGLLLKVIPELKEGRAEGEYQALDGVQVRLQLTREGPYTAIMLMSHGLGSEGRLIPDIRLEVRIYHDACMAEVVAYQGQRRFRPYYSMPNRYMYQPHEKQLVNIFLHDWLRFCIRESVRFEPPEQG